MPAAMTLTYTGMPFYCPACTFPVRLLQRLSRLEISSMCTVPTASCACSCSFGTCSGVLPCVLTFANTDLAVTPLAT